MSDAHQPAGFWQEQAGRFGDLRRRNLQQSTHPLAAGFHPNGWGVDDLKSFHHKAAGRWLLARATPQVIEDFKSIAAVCAVRLGWPNTDLAWVDWLEALRRQSIDFDSGDVSLESLATERRPDPDVDVVAAGLLSEPSEARPQANPQQVKVGIGELEDVCDASERMCRRLADETLKRELAGQREAVPAAPSASEIVLAVQRELATRPRPRNRIERREMLARWMTLQEAIRRATAPSHFSGGDQNERADGSPTTTPKEAAKALRVPEDLATSRRRVVEPRLTALGWSTLDWAMNAKVDYNTANDYLNGLTAPRRDTIKKLADAIGIAPAELPV